MENSIYIVVDFAKQMTWRTNDLILKGEPWKARSIVVKMSWGAQHNSNNDNDNTNNAYMENKKDGNGPGFVIGLSSLSSWSY